MVSVFFETKDYERKSKEVDSIVVLLESMYCKRVRVATYHIKDVLHRHSYSELLQLKEDLLLSNLSNPILCSTVLDWNRFMFPSVSEVGKFRWCNQFYDWCCEVTKSNGQWDPKCASILGINEKGKQSQDSEVVDNPMGYQFS